jgi:hypothetical protein
MEQSNIKGNWMLLCQLAQANLDKFMQKWHSLTMEERAILREDVRVMWNRDWSNRAMYSHFLKVTE